MANNGRSEGQVEAFSGASDLLGLLCYTEKSDRDSVVTFSVGLLSLNRQQVVPSRPTWYHLGPFEEKQGSNHYLEMLDSSRLQDWVIVHCLPKVVHYVGLLPVVLSLSLWIESMNSLKLNYLIELQLALVAERVVPKGNWFEQKLEAPSNLMRSLELPSLIF